MRLQHIVSVVLSFHKEPIIHTSIIELNKRSVRVLFRKLLIDECGEFEGDVTIMFKPVVIPVRFWIWIDPAIVRRFQSALKLVGNTTTKDSFIAKLVNMPIIVESL